MIVLVSLIFFFNDTATTEIYTLSLHDALPILNQLFDLGVKETDRTDIVEALLTGIPGVTRIAPNAVPAEDRKSTRLNSSHANISYAVFCLKKKKTGEKSSGPYGM